MLLESKRGLDAYKLKWIVIVTMLIDHCFKVFLIFVVPLVGNLLNVENAVAYLVLLSVCGIGNITMPIFAFFIAEGCRYTHDSLKYIGRLFLFAIISEVPYQIMVDALSGLPLALEFGATNILFTFVLGAIACFVYKNLSDQNRHTIKWFAPVICCLSAYLLGSDYGAYGVLFIFISYAIINKKVKLLSLVGLVLLFCGIVYPLTDGLTYGFNVGFIIQCAIILGYSMVSILFLKSYNGERGKKSKYFFYIFYPLHMLILGGIFMFIT